MQETAPHNTNMPRDDGLLLYSLHDFWPIIRRILLDAKVGSMCEIGVEKGTLAKELIEFSENHGARYSGIDPTITSIDFSSHASEKGCVELFPDTSLRVLPNLPAHDAYFIDGDHNHYTVSNELRLILRDRDHHPIIFLHDVSWPWARRDQYCSPADIPEHNRHPFSIDEGPVPGHGELKPWGYRGAGSNYSYGAALHEGGPRNGVLTAVEDVLDELRAREPAFFTIPLIFGMGILYFPKVIPQGLREFLETLEHGTTAFMPLLTLVEENRNLLVLNVISGFEYSEMMRREIESLQRNWHSLNKDWHSLHGNWHSLHGNWRSLQGNWQSLRGKWQSLHGDYKELQAVYHTLKEKTHALHQKLEEAGEAEAELTRRCNRLEEVKSSLSTRVHTLEEYSGNLATVVSNLASECHRLAGYSGGQAGSPLMLRDGFREAWKTARWHRHSARDAEGIIKRMAGKGLVSLDVFSFLTAHWGNLQQMVDETLAKAMSRAGIAVTPETVGWLRKSKQQERMDINPLAAQVVVQDILSDFFGEAHSREVFSGFTGKLFDGIYNECSSVPPHLGELCRWQKGSAVRAVCATDCMFKPEKVTTLLDKLDIVECFSAVHTSAGYGCVGDALTFWRRVLTEEDAEPSHIAHAGAQFRTDFAIPRDLGIHAIWYRA